MTSDLATVQDYGSPPTETSVSMDGAPRLLRLGRLAQELGAESGFPKDVSM